ncbi:MAG: DUF3368 domain-containing protein [Planctomycetota bacterium]
MLVVSDASPLNILIRIGHTDILGQLYDRVLTTPAVIKEMSHPSTPAEVRDWVARCPTWLEIRAPSTLDLSINLDTGEREAICLARELHADLLLVDDHAARQEAMRLGLEVTGTLGVLEHAASRHLLRLPEAVEKLRRTDFRISESLLQEALKRDALLQKTPEHER